MALTNGYLRTSSLAKSTVYCLTENLDICIKSGWKTDERWEQERLKILELCKSDRHILCDGEGSTDAPERNWDDTKYTYVALKIGPVMIKMDDTVLITSTEQHFTLAYLPGLTCVHKTKMWR